MAGSITPDGPAERALRADGRAKARRDRRLALRRVRDRDIAKAINRFDRFARLASSRDEQWAIRRRTAVAALGSPRFRETIRAGEDRPRFAERAKDISVALFLGLDLVVYGRDAEEWN